MVADAEHAVEVPALADDARVLVAVPVDAVIVIADSDNTAPPDADDPVAAGVLAQHALPRAVARGVGPIHAGAVRSEGLAEQSVHPLAFAHDAGIRGAPP